jgi:hypothetical protein
MRYIKMLEKKRFSIESLHDFSRFLYSKLNAVFRDVTTKHRSMEQHSPIWLDQAQGTKKC